VEETLKKFKNLTGQLRGLHAASFLLQWDAETKMPPGGSADRGDALGVVETLVHDLYASDEIGRLLEVLEPYARELPYSSTEAGLIRFMADRYRMETRVPSELAAELATLSVVANTAWREARATNNFKHFEPYLARMVDLTRQKAEFLSSTGNPYDGMLEYFEPGIDSRFVSEVFTPLRPRLVELATAIAANGGAVDGSLIRREVPAEKQLAYGREVAEAIGYDFQRGRLDTTTHPFAWGTGKGDSRVTTRVLIAEPLDCIMGVLHEAGHAMHLQNMRDDVASTPLAYFWSGAILESQSRLFENMLGRSRAFWTAQYPRLQAAFAPAFDDLLLEQFYRALNESKRSLIRIEADEVTYGLHVMLRFEIENELINGRIDVADLPREWNARMEQYLGLTPPTDSDGVLQDVHWAWGTFGYFPGYLLGSMFAAQLWAALEKDIPDIGEQIAAGRAGAVLAWTAEHVMQHGGIFTFTELADRAVGGFSAEPYMAYLKAKYGDIYGL
jgi:carboxypeptidase Taq